ncbi:MAG: type II toxin-antitoxin system VapC family toxin [Candidatus Contendobacter sp.]|jgi:PIN domain nuclease of toxin-antitoxin system|nr:type II toxin-antitoxin system VapC family toxin [Candidatus Contendobacter sp.]
MSAYLLDTHSFLWSAFDPGKLSQPAHAKLANSGNPVYVSSVTFWEISLKAGIGKLTLTDCLPDELPGIADLLGYLPLPLEPDEAASFYRLPRATHKDPFDRMLIWQAIQRKLILISKDSAFDEYRSMGLQTFW